MVQPPAVVDDQLVCYAVEAREQTETSPEFVVTDDPRDPVFYSTCFVREMDVRWLPPPGGRPPPVTPSYAFGDLCVDCTSYSMNQAPTNASMLIPPVWRTTANCVDCNAAALANPSVVCDSADVQADLGAGSGAPDGSSGGSGGGSAAGIAVGVIVALVAVVALAFFVHRRRMATASQTHKFKVQHNSVVISAGQMKTNETYDNPVFEVPKPNVPMPTRKAVPTARASVDRSGPVAIVSYVRPQRSASADDDAPLVIKPTDSSSAVSKLSLMANRNNQHGTPSAPTPPPTTSRPIPPMPTRKVVATTTSSSPASAVPPPPARTAPKLAPPSRIAPRMNDVMPPAEDEDRLPPLPVDDSDSDADVDVDAPHTSATTTPTPKPRSQPPSSRPPSLAVKPSWEALVDRETKAVYFYDAASGSTRWDSPLPPCWTAVLDDELNVYVAPF